MQRFRKQTKGQFVVIAALMIAIMIVSLGAMLHVSVTYYKHEPWEEYLTLIGNIELGSEGLVNLSLANYTNSATTDSTVLDNNLQKWQNDMSKIYQGFGVALNYTTAHGTYNAFGTSLHYSSGISNTWLVPSSTSAANASFTVDVNSIGLTGYKFTSIAFLNLKILSASTSTKEITVTVKRENLDPVSALTATNFQVVGQNITKVTQHYDPTNVIAYVIQCSGTFTLPVTVKLCDDRGIMVVATGP